MPERPGDGYLAPNAVDSQRTDDRSTQKPYLQHVHARSVAQERSELAQYKHR